MLTQFLYVWNDRLPFLQVWCAKTIQRHYDERGPYKSVQWRTDTQEVPHEISNTGIMKWSKLLSSPKLSIVDMSNNISQFQDLLWNIWRSWIILKQRSHTYSTHPAGHSWASISSQSPSNHVVSPDTKASTTHTHKHTHWTSRVSSYPISGQTFLTVTYIL